MSNLLPKSNFNNSFIVFEDIVPSPSLTFSKSSSWHITGTLSLVNLKTASTIWYPFLIVSLYPIKVLNGKSLFNPTWAI